MRHGKGFSLIELLIVIAIIAIIASLAVLSWRNALKQQEEAAALHKLAGIFWLGTTRSTSEGRELYLCKQGNTLTIRRKGASVCDGAVVYELALPKDVSVELNDGRLIRFTPPGKIDFIGGNFHNPFVVTTDKGRYQYKISIIGEVQVTRL